MGVFSHVATSEATIVLHWDYTNLWRPLGHLLQLQDYPDGGNLRLANFQRRGHPVSEAVPYSSCVH